MNDILIGVLVVCVIMLTLKWSLIADRHATGYYYDRKLKTWVYGKKK